MTATPRPAPRLSWRRQGLAALALSALAVGSGATGAVVARATDSPTSAGTTIGATAPAVTEAAAGAPSESLAKVAAAVMPSVVSIEVRTPNGGGEGSGVVLRSDGTILTNNHVVAGAAGGAGRITVKLADGRTAAATIVGRDPATDLAVIRAAGLTGLTAATLGDSSSLHVGDTVLAIGSPLGLEGSVTSGIVSALHRQVQLGSAEQSTPVSASVGDAIQTDAAVNPGNSGGALVDARGRVVGINSAIATLGSGTGGQSGSIGLGFAIPIDDAKTVAEALIAGTVPQRAQLGVSVGDSPDGGALVAAVTPGSAAASAGIVEGDVITTFDGRTVNDGSDLTSAVRSQKVGDSVSVGLTRDGTQKTVQVTLSDANAT